MAPEKYRGVIAMVLRDHAGKDPDFVADRMIESIKIAQALSGEYADTGAPTQRLHTDAKAIQNNDSSRKGPVLVPYAAPVRASIISLGEAPPVAGASSVEPEGEEDIDYWESKPGKGDGTSLLTQRLGSVLPGTITLQVAGIDEPLTLIRSIDSPGMKFVYVTYKLQGQDSGPRVTVLTTRQSIDPEVILKDVSEQAACMYSKEPRRVEPRIPQPMGMPSDADIARLAVNGDNVSGEDAMTARKDAAAWANSRSSRWS